MDFFKALFHKILPPSSPYYVPVILGLAALGTYFALYVAIPMLFSMLGVLLVGLFTYQVIAVARSQKINITIPFILISFAISYIAYQILLYAGNKGLNHLMASIRNAFKSSA